MPSRVKERVCDARPNRNALRPTEHRDSNNILLLLLLLLLLLIIILLIITILITITITTGGVRRGLRERLDAGAVDAREAALRHCGLAETVIIIRLIIQIMIVVIVT